MYAIIETGSKQFKVEPGSEILVERLSGQPGDKVSFKPLMVTKANGDIDLTGGVSVEASIISEERAKKVLAFKYRPKKHSKSLKGHRQQLTRVRIVAIGDERFAEEAPAKKKPAAKKPATKPAAAKASAAKPAAEKTGKTTASTATAEKKPAAKAAATSKAPSAKTSTAGKAGVAKPAKASETAEKKPKASKPKDESAE